MRKDTKIILFIWDDEKALAFTRHLNRYDNEEANHIARLNGARIEISEVMTREEIKTCLMIYNIEPETVSRRPVIDEADITFRQPDAPFVDLFLDETSEDDSDRMTSKTSNPDPRVWAIARLVESVGTWHRPGSVALR